MIKVSVFYPNKPGSHFDSAYYMKGHMPIATELLPPRARGCLGRNWRAWRNAGTIIAGLLGSLRIHMRVGAGVH
jgi:hypothetical protein